MIFKVIVFPVYKTREKGYCNLYNNWNKMALNDKNLPTPNHLKGSRWMAIYKVVHTCTNFCRNGDIGRSYTDIQLAITV